MASAENPDPLDNDSISDLDVDTDSQAQKLVDFRSSKFNPLLALKFQGGELEIPVKNAPQYLNLSHYDKAMKDPKNAPQPIKKRTTDSLQKEMLPSSAASSSFAEVTREIKYPMPGRRFLPHQMPVYRPRREHPNTLTLMKNVEGPLSLLEKAMNEKTRIKVWTRNIDSIRGFCTGFVEAFDKHWNLALRDVDEQFQRRRKVKYPAEPHKTTENTKEKQIHVEKEKVNPQQYVCEGGKKGHVKSIEKLPSDRKDFAQKKPVLIEGPDAIKICRLGMSALSLNDKITVSRGGSETQMGDARRPRCPDVPSLSTTTTTTTNVNQKQSDAKLWDEIPSSLTKSQIKKKGLTVFKEPFKDPHGFVVIARSKKYEIVQRHVGQLFMMGNDVVLIENLLS